MKDMDIPGLRLYNTGLSHSPFKNAVEAVSHLGAVQAQDFEAAKWALGLRVKNSTAADIEKAFNDGTILRIHVMRPTWHFVLPEDISWMMELTAPRVKATLASSNKKLELDGALLSRSNAAIAEALRANRYLTRQELKAVLTKIGINTSVQRLAHIISWAELDGLICSGPKQGKQFTYALMEERAPKSSKLNPEQALARLALKYFTSHGPAQIEDFSWWSGLTLKDARNGLELTQANLKQVNLHNKTYWYHSNTGENIPDPPLALLLSIYDEYAIAYKDRSDISDDRDIEWMISKGATFTSIIVLNGKVAGGWKKALKKKAIEIRLNPFRKISRDEREALESEVTRYGRFFDTAAVLME